MFSDLSEVVQLCQQMVRIPSVNPQADMQFSEPYGEERIAAFVCDWFAKNGFTAQLQPVGPGRKNVFIIAEGLDKSKTLLISSHMDTVDVKDMTIEPFAAKAKDGKIYGRGSCDVKGSLAAMMIAFRDRVQQGFLPYNLALLATCGEEYDMAGAEYFVENLPTKISGVLFGEPTNFKVDVGHKGVVRLLLETTGKSAHSSRLKTGKNAIYAMARAIIATEKFIESMDQWPEHPQLGCETAAVTIIEGGQQINVIPDRCQAGVDWRILHGSNSASCRDKLVKFLKTELSEEILVESINSENPVQIDPTHQLVAAVLDSVQKICKVRQTNYATGATDASAFTSLGIPTPIFGPGNMAKAHTQDEHIEIADLENGLEIYKTYLAGDWGI